MALAKDRQKQILDALKTNGPVQAAMLSAVQTSETQQPTEKNKTSLNDQLGRLADVANDKSLGDETKAGLASVIGEDRAPYAISKAISAYAKSDGFRALPQSKKEEALYAAESDLGGYEARPGSPTSVKQSQAALSNTEALKELGSEDQERLQRLVKSKTPIGQQARDRLSTIMKTPVWNRSDTKTQAQILKTLPNFGVLPEGVNNLTPNEKPVGTASVSKSHDVETTFEDGSKGPATEHDIELKRGDRTFNVKVQMPKEAVKGRVLPTLAQVQDALTRLPDDQLNSIATLIVNPDGKPGSGMSTMGNDGRVHISPAHSSREATKRFQPGEIAEILSHEVGHLQSITPWGNDETAKAWKDWDAARDKDGIAPSDYANQNGPEDFAEAYALYRSLEKRPKEMEEYRKLFPNRFAIIESLLKSPPPRSAHQHHRH